MAIVSVEPRRPTSESEIRIDAIALPTPGKAEIIIFLDEMWGCDVDFLFQKGKLIGREMRQGEGVVEFDGRFFRIATFDELTG